MKPENIVIGQGKKSNQAYIIDLGLAKRYICPKSGTHIAMKTNKGMIGTTKFASLSTHQGNEASRRDDLESLFFMMIYFRRQGKLPWDLNPPQLQEYDSRSTKALEIQLANE